MSYLGYHQSMTPLSCLFCHHVFEEGEIFLSFIHGKKHEPVISECGECANYYPHQDDKPERNGYWCELFLNEDGRYEILEEEKEVMIVFEPEF